MNIQIVATNIAFHIFLFPLTCLSLNDLKIGIAAITMPIEKTALIIRCILKSPIGEDIADINLNIVTIMLIIHNRPITGNRFVCLYAGILREIPCFLRFLNKITDISAAMEPVIKIIVQKTKAI